MLLASVSFGVVRMGRLIDHAGNGRARLMIEALIREYKTRLTDLLL